MEGFEESILKAVEEYNCYRSPEAKASLFKIDDGEVIIDFEGSFCRTCGTYDYLEDFIYELKRISEVEIEIADHEKQGPEKIRVKYTANTHGKKE